MSSQIITCKYLCDLLLFQEFNNKVKNHSNLIDDQVYFNIYIYIYIHQYRVILRIYEDHAKSMVFRQ